MSDLHQLEAQLSQVFNQHKASELNLDLTRGKPSPEQLDLSNSLDGILNKKYTYNSVDTRNYGGIDGLPEMKALFADILDTEASRVVVGGNSSLSLMHQTLMFAQFLGIFENQAPWSKQPQTPKFICPVPGYDRHFSLCESLGIEMINVDISSTGPDMDAVEALVKNDVSIKGIWNVPRFSNPTGYNYSDDTVKRMAELSNIAAANDFIVMWDNAYAVHELENNLPALASIDAYANAASTQNHIVQFASTSKISFAGSGIAAMSSGETLLTAFKKHLAMSTIGPDKVNQIRHLHLFTDINGLKEHMKAHAALLKPRFDLVLKSLEDNLDSSLATWTRPDGGYFISLDTQSGLAQSIVQLCAELGVKITPAGATFPYGKDPEDKNIRIAPSFSSLEDIDKAMQVLTTCVKLATVRKQLSA